MAALIIGALAGLAVGAGAGWWVGSRRRAGGEMQESPAKTGPSVKDRLLVNDMIEACVGHGAAALVVCARSGISATCRFVVADNGVALDLIDEDFAGHFAPAGLICVQFTHRGNAAVFATTVVQVQGMRLIAEQPKDIAHAEARMAFRIPVDACVGLKLEVVVGRERIAAQAKDISRLGILVMLDKACAPIRVDAVVELEMALGSLREVVPCTVRRVDATMVGLFFHESLVDGEVHATKRLEAIVQHLEAAWVRRRNQHLVTARAA